MPLLKVGKREMALEAGLHRMGRLPKATRERRKLIAKYLLDLAEAASLLSKNDLAILQALREEGTISAAASALRPDRPGYRTYVQRRLKYFEHLAEKAARKISFLI